MRVTRQEKKKKETELNHHTNYNQLFRIKSQLTLSSSLCISSREKNKVVVEKKGIQVTRVGKKTLIVSSEQIHKFRSKKPSLRCLLSIDNNQETPNKKCTWG